jgi:hypothetical protein
MIGGGSTIAGSIILGAAIIAGAVVATGRGEPGRYQIVTANEFAAWRLDTVTGALLACRQIGTPPNGGTPSTAGAACWLVPTDPARVPTSIVERIGGDDWQPLQPEPQAKGPRFPGIPVSESEATGAR